MLKLYLVAYRKRVVPFGFWRVIVAPFVCFSGA